VELPLVFLAELGDRGSGCHGLDERTSDQLSGVGQVQNLRAPVLGVDV